MTNVQLEIFLQIKSQSVALAMLSRSLSVDSPYDVIKHRHEDNSSLELCWFAHFVHERLGLCRRAAMW